MVLSSTVPPLGYSTAGSAAATNVAALNVSTRPSMPITSSGGSAESVNLNAGKPWGPSSSGGAAGGGVAVDPMKLMMGSSSGSAGVGGGVNNHQAIAFVHENDIYYKPKVQQDLVCRITTTGEWWWWVVVSGVCRTMDKGKERTV